MKNLVIVLAGLCIAGCASSAPEETENPNQINDAVQDFVNLQGLKEVVTIRDFDNPNQMAINERYIIAYRRHDQYLIEYAHDCRFAEIDNSTRLPDKRRRTRVLTIKTDTFRGCPMKAAWPITLAQAQELMIIGQGPGETAN